MFEHFISLGHRCATAFTTSRYGLRAFSCPFDWLVTRDFSWVLRDIETDFVDFLRQDRLEQSGNHSKNFIDKTSGFIFQHDREDYRTEFTQLREKYDRRIERFISASHQRTCFLRHVAGQEELDYILAHTDYIRHVISKYNQQNEIVFLADKELKIPRDLPFRIFPVAESYAPGFNEANDLLEFCGQNYSGSAISIIRNLLFEDKKGKFQQMHKRLQTLAAVSVHDFSKDRLPPQVVIYGAGALGQALYEKIRHLTQVECFIDRSKYGAGYCGVPIRAVDDVKDIEATTILVSTTYDFETVKADIHKKRTGITVASLDDFIALK